MSRRFAPLVVAAAAVGMSVIAATGCGGTGGGACAAYVEHYNGLACSPASLDDDYCSASEDECNRADYWQCLQDNQSCDGDEFVNTTDDCDPRCR